MARLVGPKGRHNPARAAVRHGSEPGQVTLGGRRVRIRRPRVRSADGTRELPVPTYQAFAPTELLDQLALERMLAKLSTRRYPARQAVPPGERYLYLPALRAALDATITNVIPTKEDAA